MAITSLLRQKVAESLAANGRDAAFDVLEAMTDVLAGAASGSGGATSPGAETLATPALLGASGSQSVPAGAKGWTVIILAGTATVAGTAGIPTGVTLSSSRVLATSFTVTTAASSSALVVWTT